MQITWYGTASLIIQDGDNKILFDPFFTITDEREYYRKRYKPLFQKCNAIVITHGHFDHIRDVPEIVSGIEIPIYCTKTPLKVLTKKGVPKERITCIAPGDTFSIGDIEITAFKGSHAAFGLPLILSTITKKRFWKMLPLAAQIGASSIMVEREAKEILVFQVSCKGKTILILGSLGIYPNEKYPQNIDMLVLPYQGRSDLLDYSIKLIDMIKPRIILLDHFNDYCPPISSEVDYSELVKWAEDNKQFSLIAPKREEEFSL